MKKSARYAFLLVSFVVLLFACGGGGGDGVGAPPTAPTAPSNLLASAVTNTSITLTWTDASNNEDGFQIESGANGTDFTLLGTVAANSTSYPNSGLTPWTTHYYRVRAHNSAGDSAYSNTINATTYCRVTAPGDICPAILTCTAYIPPLIINGIEYGLCL